MMRDMKQSPEQVAKEVFAMLDSDKSGEVTKGELADKLRALDSGINDDDVEAAMSLFDPDGTGKITEIKFVFGVEQMHTFA